MAHEVIVLASVGRHPVSLRPRLADRDARALAIASRTALPATALHAGPAAHAAPLRACLGMGAERLIVLDMPEDADPLPALQAWLADARPRVVLAGQRAEAGEGSGMTPFWLAERMGWALATGVVDLRLSADAARATQALAHGRRRVVEAASPVLLTVDRTAPDPPLSATARALRGLVEQSQGAPIQRDERALWPTAPARRRPRPLAAPGTSGPGVAPTARRELLWPEPAAAADAILDFLEREALIVAGPRSGEAMREPAHCAETPT